MLERAFAILEAFTEFHPEWTTSDLARHLDLPIPTVHRLLAALARLGYVTRDTFASFYREAAQDVRAFLDGRPVRVINP